MLLKFFTTIFLGVIVSFGFLLPFVPVVEAQGSVACTVEAWWRDPHGTDFTHAAQVEAGSAYTVYARYTGEGCEGLSGFIDVKEVKSGKVTGVRDTYPNGYNITNGSTINHTVYKLPAGQYVAVAEARSGTNVIASKILPAITASVASGSEAIAGCFVDAALTVKSTKSPAPLDAPLTIQGTVRPKPNNLCNGRTFIIKLFVNVNGVTKPWPITNPEYTISYTSGVPKIWAININPTPIDLGFGKAGTAYFTLQALRADNTESNAKAEVTISDKKTDGSVPVAADLVNSGKSLGAEVVTPGKINPVQDSTVLQQGSSGCLFNPLSSNTNALTCKSDDSSELGGNTGTLISLMLKLTRGIAIGVSVWATLFIMIAAFKMVISGGSAENITAAKSTIQWSLVGVVISLTAFGIVSAVMGLLGVK